MSRVLLEMSMSLDGYVTGPDVSDEEPLGRGGEALHEWMFAGRSPDEVVTHRAAETIEKKGGTSYIFVTGGVTEALRRAQDAAGSKDVLLNGGAEINRQFLHAGLVDEVRLHLVPAAFGRGRAPVRRGVLGSRPGSKRRGRHPAGHPPHLPGRPERDWRELTAQKTPPWRGFTDGRGGFRTCGPLACEASALLLSYAPIGGRF